TPDAAPAAVVVRTATAADTDGIVAVWDAVFPEYNDPAAPQRHPRGSIERKLAWDDMLWVAERDGRIVGTVLGGYDGHRGWLYSLAVLPELRGLGVARRLVRAAEERLAAEGCPRVNVQVYSHNAEGVAFWETLGYANGPIFNLARSLL
ncbi:GNAT family acetyltransferase, partial [Micrococcus luteus]